MAPPEGNNHIHSTPAACWNHSSCTEGEGWIHPVINGSSKHSQQLWASSLALGN